LIFREKDVQVTAAERVFVEGYGVGRSLDIPSGSRLGQLLGVRCCAEKKVKNRNPLRFAIDLEMSDNLGNTLTYFSHKLICC